MSNQIQIISPHIDDSFLSLGGCIDYWQAEGKVVNVHNIFTISDWVSASFRKQATSTLDIEFVSKMRKKEEIRLSDNVGFTTNFYDFPEYPHRANLPDEIKLQIEQDIVKKLDNIINQDDMFFFPIGIEHPDHLLIHRLSFKYLNQGIKMFYYEDMPYFSFGKIEYQRLSELCGTKCDPILQKFNLAKKRRSLEEYRSQVDENWFLTMMPYSYNILDDSYYERYWRVR
jgi:LmbE family N-acetylglucosaminyl deacetylase